MLHLISWVSLTGQPHNCICNGWDHMNLHIAYLDLAPNLCFFLEFTPSNIWITATLLVTVAQVGDIPVSNRRILVFLYYFCTAVWTQIILVLFTRIMPNNTTLKRGFFSAHFLTTFILKLIISFYKCNLIQCLTCWHVHCLFIFQTCLQCTYSPWHYVKKSTAGKLTNISKIILWTSIVLHLVE